MKVLVLNSGSSSLKYQLIDSETEEAIAKGIAERIGVPGGGGNVKLEMADGRGAQVGVVMNDHDEAMNQVFALLTDPNNGAVSGVGEISAVGHRVVHGGEKFVSSILVNNGIVDEIDKMSALAPLHNPPNLQGIRSCMKLMPGVPQVAVFDTAFHATMPEYAYTYALPLGMRNEHGIRRYGFHGTSHKYVARQAQKILAERGLDQARTRIITAHLGNGCSMAAVVGGKVVDTSMGMTPAEGLVMGTRSGDLDPAILLFLARELGHSHDEVDDLINKKSGPLGVSGQSSDMRDIEAASEAGDGRAELALQIFCYRIRKYIGAYTAAMGGVDAVVFTGGIGENCWFVRARVMAGLEALGMELDPAKNKGCRVLADLSTDASPARVLLIPTNEERMIARETVQVVSGNERNT